MPMPAKTPRPGPSAAQDALTPPRRCVRRGTMARCLQSARWLQIFDNALREGCDRTRAGEIADLAVYGKIQTLV